MSKQANLVLTIILRPNLVIDKKSYQIRDWDSMTLEWESQRDFPALKSLNPNPQISQSYENVTD